MKLEIRRRIVALLAPLAQDALGLGGLAGVVFGVDMISRPAALIVGGLAAITVAVLWSRRA